LTLLPIFLDESKHLNWTQRLRGEPHFLKPLQDGKLLQVAVTSVTVPLCSDPLWAGRLTSVMAGVLGLWAALGLGRALYDERVGLLAAALYVFCPFALFYDRMNLADVYLSSFAALSLLATVRLVQAPRLRAAVWLAAALTACVLSKIPGLLVLAIPVAGALLLRAEKQAWKALATAYALAALLLVLPVAYFFAHSTQIEAKAAVVADSRLALVIENLGLAAEWLWAYWTPPWIAAGVAAAVIALYKRRPADLLLLAAALLPVAAFVPVAFHWFPRYLLLATVPFLVLVARLLGDLLDLAAPLRRGPRLWLVAAGAVALLAPALVFDAWLLWDPVRAPLPAVERFQFVSGWPSGYGWRDALARLQEERRAHPELTIVADREGHRTGQWALTAAFLNDHGVEVRGLESGEPASPGLLRQWAGERPTYFVTTARVPRFEPTARLDAQMLGTFTKPNGQFVCNLYRLVPRGE
jgi:4-amino-4-deoxy-L-arabinose transferase-like glycosyltransferase